MFASAFRSRGPRSVAVRQMCLRHVMSGSSGSERKIPKTENGLIIGMYSMNDGVHETSKFTPTGAKLNEKSRNEINGLLKIAGPSPKLGECRFLYDVDLRFPILCIVGLGHERAGYCEGEQMDVGKENIRIAAGAAARLMCQFELSKIFVECLGHAESAAEGAALSIWFFQEFKNSGNRRIIPALELFDNSDWSGWQIGLQKAVAQNLARHFMETPGNFMTPIIFAQKSVEILCKTGINVEVRVRDWCESLGMGAFLTVSKGSCQSSLFMELSYCGSGNYKERPVVLIGKGCTFDSGGICLNEQQDMELGRGDLAGAACIVAACKAIASLRLPINIKGLIPLCECMPGSKAMRPGDVAIAMNGKSIFIQDTRCAGRLMLADALCYAQTFCPEFVVDVGSMTRGVRSCLGTAAVGVFTNSNKLWNLMRISAINTGDRVWRMPLFNMYATKFYKATSSDIGNCGEQSDLTDPSECAAFLGEFVPCGEWLHMDNSGVAVSDGKTDPPYLGKGMTGRPTRTLIEFISQLCCRGNA